LKYIYIAAALLISIASYYGYTIKVENDNQEIAFQYFRHCDSRLVTIMDAALSDVPIYWADKEKIAEIDRSIALREHGYLSDIDIQIGEVKSELENQNDYTSQITPLCNQMVDTVKMQLTALARVNVGPQTWNTGFIRTAKDEDMYLWRKKLFTNFGKFASELSGLEKKFHTEQTNLLNQSTLPKDLKTRLYTAIKDADVFKHHLNEDLIKSIVELSDAAIDLNSFLYEKRDRYRIIEYFGTLKFYNPEDLEQYKKLYIDVAEAQKQVRRKLALIRNEKKAAGL